MDPEKPLKKQSDEKLVALFKACIQASEESENSDQAKAALAEADTVFQVLYHRHWGFVFGNARRLLVGHRPEDAEELAQDVFVIVKRKLPSFECNPPKAKLTTWLYKITEFTTRNFNRKLKKELECLCQMPDTDVELHQLSGELGVFLPADPIEKAESENAMREAIESLPEDQKKVICLYINGLNRGYKYSYEEMALILNITVATIRWLLRAARQSLKRRLRR